MKYKDKGLNRHILDLACLTPIIEPTDDEKRVIDEEHTDFDEPEEVEEDHDYSLDGVAERLNREVF